MILWALHIRCHVGFLQKDHEVYRQWVGLVDEQNPADRGIQGYLQVSADNSTRRYIEAHDRALEQAAEWAKATKTLVQP